MSKENLNVEHLNIDSDSSLRFIALKSLSLIELMLVKK